MKKSLKCLFINLVVSLFFYGIFTAIMAQDSFPGTALDFEGTATDYAIVD